MLTNQTTRDDQSSVIMCSQCNRACVAGRLCINHSIGDFLPLGMVPHSPVAMSGMISVQDELVAVDNVNVQTMTVEHVVRLLRGQVRSRGV